jgi:nitroreductase
MQKKEINGYPFIKHSKLTFDDQTLLQRSSSLLQYAQTRRTCREFSSKPINKRVIENILLTANTAPSGANKQPWKFCVVSDPAIKQKIRVAAEAEEKESYEKRMNEEWLQDLRQFATDWHKPFLEIAPYLIVVFRKPYDLDANGQKIQNYYVNESVGLACGMLLNAIHHAGLTALTHTPSPMQFLNNILQRPENEKPFLLIPVGHLADECWVPDIKRKNLNEISEWF